MEFLGWLGVSCGTVHGHDSLRAMAGNVGEGVAAITTTT